MRHVDLRFSLVRLCQKSVDLADKHWYSFVSYALKSIATHYIILIGLFHESRHKCKQIGRSGLASLIPVISCFLSAKTCLSTHL